MPGIVQASFTSGELAPALHGRVDLARYFTGLKIAENFIVRQYGGISNRSGTRLVAAVKDPSKRVRLIPFQFSVEQTYCLEFGEEYVRVHKDGETVVKTLADTDAWVTATGYAWGQFIKQSNVIYYCLDNHVSGTFATDLANGCWVAQNIYEIPTLYLEADLPLLKFTQSADVMTICHNDFPPMQLSRSAHNNWSMGEFDNINGPFLDMNTSDTTTVYSSAVGGAVVLTASEAMFAATDVGRYMRIEQMPDDTSKRWEVDKAVVTGDIRRAGGHYYMCLASGTTGTVRPTVSQPGDTESDGAVRWQYLHSGYGLVKILEYTSTTSVKAEVMRRLPESVVMASTNAKQATNLFGYSGKCRITITAHGFTSNDYVFISGFTYLVLVMAGKGSYYHAERSHEVNGWWRIVNIDANTIEVPDCAYVHTVEDKGTVTKSASGMPTYKWCMGSWGESVGFPATTGYYQQRQFFGGATLAPQTLEASCIRGYNNFLRSPDPLDDEGITYTINAREVNQIRHFLPLSDLIVLTSGGEWMVKGDDAGVLIPATINAKIQGYGGASHVPPVVIGSTGLYVQNKGQQVRAIGYSFADDAFVSQDLTTLSSHMFLGYEIQEWVYQQVPFSCVWAVRNDGTLLGLTYLREQEVVGWHRHVTDGLFESICSIPEGDEDGLYCVVKRTINGSTQRFIERFAPRDITDVKDAFHVDCGLTYDGRNTGATTLTLSGGTLWDQTEELSLTATAAIFSAGDVGNAFSFIVGDIVYRLSVVGYTSSTLVTVQPNRIIPVAYRSAAFTDWTKEVDHLSGLGHLEGETVSILADGNVHPQLVVTSGAITLQHTAGVVHVGLPFVSTAETLAITTPSANIRDSAKLISKVGMIVESSRGIWAGPDANNLIEYKGRSDEGYDAPVGMETGFIELRTLARWDKNGSVMVKQSDPLPLSILALIPGVEVGM